MTGSRRAIPGHARFHSPLCSSKIKIAPLGITDTLTLHRTLGIWKRNPESEHYSAFFTGLSCLLGTVCNKKVLVMKMH